MATIGQQLQCHTLLCVCHCNISTRPFRNLRISAVQLCTQSFCTQKHRLGQTAINRSCTHWHQRCREHVCLPHASTNAPCLQHGHRLRRGLELSSLPDPNPKSAGCCSTVGELDAALFHHLPAIQRVRCTSTEVRPPQLASGLKIFPPATALETSHTCAPSQWLLRSTAQTQRPQNRLADREGVEYGAAEEVAVCGWKFRGSAVAAGLDANKEEEDNQHVIRIQSPITSSLAELTPCRWPASSRRATLHTFGQLCPSGQNQHNVQNVK